MGLQTILLICLGFSAIHIVNAIHSWEFGKDNIPEATVTTRYRGYFTIFEKQQHIHLAVPPCHVVTYVKVQVRNLISIPKVLYNSDTNVVTIYYGFWDLSTSTFGITAKSVLQEGCQVGPSVQQRHSNDQPPHPVQDNPTKSPFQPVQTPQRPPVQQRPPNGQPQHPVQDNPTTPPFQPAQPPQHPPVQQGPSNGQPPHPVQDNPTKLPFQPVQPPQRPPVQQRPPNGQPPHPVQDNPTRPPFQPVQPPQRPPVQQEPRNGQAPHLQDNPTRPPFQPVQPHQRPPVQQRPPNGPHDPNTIPRLNAEEQSSQKDQEDLQNDQTIQTVKDPHDPTTQKPRLNADEQNSQKIQEDSQSVPDEEHNEATETEDGKKESNK